MSHAQFTREGAAPPAGGRAFDADLHFLSRWSGPLGLLARVMLAYIFIVEGVGKIGGYAGVADYMQAHGVDGRLLPLVILTELGGGLLVLFGFCLLTSLFFHFGADQTVQMQKNIAMAGAFSLWRFTIPAPGLSTAGEGARFRARRRNGPILPTA